MYTHIIVPIAPEHAADSSRAFEIARTLLDDGGRITALTVIESIPAYAAQQLPAGLLESNREESEAKMKAELGGVKDVKPVAVIGHAATSILEYASNAGADCIVMASHRPGLSDYFLGSTAGRVVRHAQCSVHVIR